MSLLARLRRLVFGPPEPPPFVGEMAPTDPCWCGSGRAYRRCHRASDRAKGRGALPGRPGPE